VLSLILDQRQYRLGAIQLRITPSNGLVERFLKHNVGFIALLLLLLAIEHLLLCCLKWGTLKTSINRKWINPVRRSGVAWNSRYHHIVRKPLPTSRNGAQDSRDQNLLLTMSFVRQASSHFTA
jgi:hypothetical protein